jgi:predicted nucleic acid-binding protein
MGDRAFADTNIVLRLVNPSLPLHAEITLLIQQLQAQKVEFWISRQIIREYLVQVTRPGILQTPLTSLQCTAHVKVLRALFSIADETEAVTNQLLQLLEQFPTGGRQIHDANIVATMLVYQIDTLLTLNIADMKRFAPGVTLRSPLSA